MNMNLDGRKFDVIYSNKTMIYFDENQMRQAFEMQHRVLNVGGMLAHSFWYGDEVEVNDAFTSYYYNEDKISQMIDGLFEIEVCYKYKEMDFMEDDDSIFLIMKKIE